MLVDIDARRILSVAGSPKKGTFHENMKHSALYKYITRV